MLPKLDRLIQVDPTQYDIKSLKRGSARLPVYA
jgi:hypothetical protein